jgi:hypothetical protein
VSFRREFMDNVRQQLAADTESTWVWLMRRNAAGLSAGFGFLGLILPLPMALGDVSWAAVPGALLLIAGGVLGFVSWFSGDVWVSRRSGAWAALCTAVGFTEVSAVLALG